MRITETKLIRFWGLVVFIWLATASFSWAQRDLHAIVVAATSHVLAPPLRLTVPLSTKSTRLGLPPEDDEGLAAHGSRPTRSSILDSVLQTSPDTSPSNLTSLSTNSGLNILGLGAGFSGYTQQANVPDTNGAAGPTQFVQWVNESFAVFNKSNGALVYGPASGNTLWQALGGACAANPNLDGSVQFDKLANRWVMMMPVFGEAPPYLCVAVSTTSNAVNGGWSLYAFEPPASTLCDCRLTPDYPKLGVWPDGYYITYNQGYSGNFEGAAACVLNRNNMLDGAPATMQCFMNIPKTYGALLPGDLDGTTAPPAGSPDYFVDFDSNHQSLDVWQFHVNWTTPANSTFSGPSNIPVAAFNEACGESTVELNYTSGACIPQLGTSQELDSYGDRIMYRLAYRNLGTHQSLVINQTVSTGTTSSNTAIRWYELQNTGSGFQLYQQGTYAPDSSYRWMGSIAMDKAGDIAVGYSVSSSTMNPSIRYTGRVPGDPLGQMESEVDLLSQANVTHVSRSGSLHWGDYSSMAVDPADDCTFWYTTEYQPASTSYWGTRIASFKFPSCASAASSWSVVNEASNFGNPISSLTIPTTGSGHLIAIAVMFNGSTSVARVSDNAGNTYVSAGARSSIGQFSTEIWYAVSSNSGASVVTPQFVGSPTHVEITSWEVSGVSTAAPDAENTASGNVVANNTPGAAATTTQSGDFVLTVLFANAAEFSGISSGNEFTDDFHTNGNGWAHISNNSATPGTHQASWYTASPTGTYCSSTAAFHPAS